MIRMVLGLLVLGLVALSEIKCVENYLDDYQDLLIRDPFEPFDSRSTHDYDSSEMEADDDNDDDDDSEDADDYYLLYKALDLNHLRSRSRKFNKQALKLVALLNGIRNSALKLTTTSEVSKITTTTDLTTKLASKNESTTSTTRAISAPTKRKNANRADGSSKSCFNCNDFEDVSVCDAHEEYDYESENLNVICCNCSLDLLRQSQQTDTDDESRPSNNGQLKSISSNVKFNKTTLIILTSILIVTALVCLVTLILIVKQKRAKSRQQFKVYEITDLKPIGPSHGAKPDAISKSTRPDVAKPTADADGSSAAEDGSSFDDNEPEAGSVDPTAPSSSYVNNESYEEEKPDAASKREVKQEDGMVKVEEEEKSSKQLILKKMIQEKPTQRPYQRTCSKPTMPSTATTTTSRIYKKQ